MKKDSKFKEKEILDILNEMKLDDLKRLGFTDLLIETCYKNKYHEKFERYGSRDGFKTIIPYEIEKTSHGIIRNRLNNVRVDDCFIQDGILTIAYENGKHGTFALYGIVKFFIMKQNDDKIY